MCIIQTDAGLNYICYKIVQSLMILSVAASKFRENWSSMITRLELLRNSIAKLESKIASFEDPYHEVPTKVTIWLWNAKKTLIDCDTLLSKIDSMGTGVTNQSLRHFGTITKIKYGKRVQKLSDELAEINKEYGSLGLPVIRNIYPQAIEVPFVDPKHVVGIDAMVEALKTSLTLENISVIGLYGDAGIGKTTILNQLLKEIKGTHGFQSVITVQVQVLTSGSIDLSNIVDEIGRQVLIHDDQWKTKSLAEKVRFVLTGLSVKKFLLLLDGVPGKIDLNTIGVPTPRPENGSKVLFTCRERSVCSFLQPEKKFKVERLSPEDAWNLFYKYVTPAIDEQSKLDDPEIRKLAIEVCAQCDGVPVKIVSTGMLMESATTLAEWEQCLETFKNRSSSVGNENPSNKFAAAAPPSMGTYAQV